MRRLLCVFGAVLLMGSVGCALTSGGLDTSNRATWAQDCGVTAPQPSSLPVLVGQRPSPNAIILKPEELPKGMIGIIKSDECTGAGPGGAKVQVNRQSLRVVRLVPSSDTSPLATGTAKVYGMVEIPPSDWPK